MGITFKNTPRNWAKKFEDLNCNVEVYDSNKDQANKNMI